MAIHHVLVCPAAKVEPLRRDFSGASAVVPDAGKAGGLYGALNAGLAAADAAGLAWDWFTYLNDDDLLAPGFAELIRRHCRPENLATVAYGDIGNIDGDDRPLGRMTVEKNPHRFASLLQGGISPVGQQGMVFGAPVVRALGGYRPEHRLCGDLDFWVRAHARKFRFQYYPLMVGRFRIQVGQLSGDVGLTRRELAAIAAEQFPAPVPALTRRVAALRYRLANVPRYLERWRAVGRPTTSETLLGRGGLAVPAPRPQP